MTVVLYQFPASRSRVTMTALEEIGLEYEDRCVNIRTAAQKAPEYLAINPKAKIPALEIDGTIMTENAAILAFLDRRHPTANLLPRTGDPVTDNQGLSDLVWCSGTIHPFVRQVRMPIKLTKADPSGVRPTGSRKRLSVRADGRPDRRTLVVRRRLVDHRYLSLLGL